jgi:hypothetical protein
MKTINKKISNDKTILREYVVLFFFLISLVSPFSSAQISLTGGSYSQNFNTYSGTPGSVPTGWSINFEARPRYNATGAGLDPGTSGVWAFGNSGDYSIGSISDSYTGMISISVNFINNTGQTITNLTFEWNYEQWRYVTNKSEFSIFGTGELAGNSIINNQTISGFIPSTKGTNGIVTITHKSINLNPVKILNGTSFGLQWNLIGYGSQGISIDDFQLTGPSPLPVELTSFSVSIIGYSVKLNWATATEVNNYGFEILRQAHTSTTLSVTGWEKIGFVNGNGNSNSPKSYGFDDKSVASGKYSYRLKQIDNDGQFEYSKEIEVDLGTPKNFELNQNYPNPFNPATVIKYQLPSSSFVTLKIYDTIGNEVATLVNEQKDSGDYEVKFDGSSLASGMYIYQLNAGEFVITKKMILLR